MAGVQPSVPSKGPTKGVFLWPQPAPRVLKVKFGSNKRTLGPVQARAVSLIAVAMSCFQLYFTLFTVPSQILFRGGHLIFALVLVFFLFPARSKSEKDRTRIAIYDYILAALATLAGVYIIVVYQDLIWRMGNPYNYEVVLGCVTILLILEAARRAAGLPLMIVGVLFMAYILLGDYSPILPHAGFSISRTVGTLYMTLDGIYGLPIGVMTSFVFLFILFSSFLTKTGVGDFLINLSFAAVGRYTAGPAKAACVASGFFGSISGSIPANVVGTGTFTIPMMKRLGYAPHFAGAVEVAASTGGQMMPPIMGAAAFIMAEWTGIPYSKIILVSVAPALLYYVAVVSFIHFNALKNDIGAVMPGDVPSFKATFKEGWYYLLPVVVVIGLLMYGYSPMRSAVGGIFSAVFIHILDGLLRRKHAGRWLAFARDMGRDLLEALDNGAKGALAVSAAMALAGIIFGAVGLTGVGLRLSGAIIDVTGGSLILTIALVALASLVMGMEMPVAASYVIIAIPGRAGPENPGHTTFDRALDRLLVQPGRGRDSAGLPLGVCGGGHCRGPAHEDGYHRLETGARGLYIMPPLLFAYTKLVNGTFIEVLQISLVAVVGFICMAAAWEGYFLKKSSLVERLTLALIAVLAFWPRPAASIAGLGFGL